MKPGDQVGPFVLEKALGSGAMGTVLRARHIETGQRVAIKVVAPALAANEKSIERFKRESAILKQLKHPNVVRLIAVGKYQGTPFYAMEYVEGESLAQVMARRGRITWEELIPLGQQLCAALQHVHERGIIHRDLKPSNVMVLPDGTVKLTDFGIAKDTDVTALTAANCTVGTASYMSPEQCKGARDLTPRSDLYSLGVLFYELLTGKKPFEADSPMEMFLHHINDTPERPSRLVLEIPVWLDTLIMQLLEKSPEQRPYSATAVAEALGRVQEKALALQSAGVDLVRSRAGDRKPGRPRLEEEDKEAARTLLGKKKKRKKRGTPFYQQTWFRAAILASLLAIVVGVIYFLVKPASPETLYGRAFDLIATNDPDDLRAARDGPIATFLDRYWDRDDTQARQMRKWADEVDRKTREMQMYNRREARYAPEDDAEKHARFALEAEEQGDLDTAEKGWKLLPKVQPWPNKQNADQRAWGLVAQKHEKDIQDTKARYNEIKDVTSREHLTKKPYEATIPLAQKAVQAIRAELQAEHAQSKGDTVAARKHWAEAREHWQAAKKAVEAQNESSQEGRLWKLMALWRLRQLSAVEKDKTS
jgi:predicted Ser/Thr protein kinase